MEKYLNNIKNILLISGSPRKGNTEFVLNKIHKKISKDYKSDLLLLRKKKIKHCVGCLKCDKTNKCTINDDMKSIEPLIEASDLIVVGTPNYYDNITGLLKNFFDRTNPYYNTDILNNKKIIFFVVGGGSISHSQRVNDHVLKYFADGHGLKIVKDYTFKALEPKKIKNDTKQHTKIQQIISQIYKTIPN